MSRVHFLLILLLVSVTQAELQRSEYYPVDYMLIMENSCVTPWKEYLLPIGQFVYTCGCQTGDELAILSSVFETLNARLKDPKTQLDNIPLIPFSLSAYLVWAKGYTKAQEAIKPQGSRIKWEVLSKITKFESIYNITYDDLVKILKNGNVVPVKVNVKDLDLKADGQLRWGLLESVTCDNKVTDKGQLDRSCYFCARVNLRLGTQITFCSPPRSVTQNYGPSSDWEEAYAFSPQPESSPSQQNTIALF